MVISIEPRIENEKLVRLLGAREERRVSPSTRNRMRKWGEEIQELVAPWLTYRVRRLVKITDADVT